MIQKVVYSKHMNRIIKKHNLMPEDQCAQSGKHADLKNAFDSAQQAVANMSVRSMGVPAKIVTMFLMCFQTMSFRLSTGYGISEDFFLK